MGETTCGGVWRRMRQRKWIAPHETETVLRRCLGMGHLTMMGVGSTIGVGIYVLIGLAAKTYAGPGILLSFLLAGLATLMNALCFAELGSRIPKTGGVYTYVYESTCQALAFLNGWLMLLGYLCSASVAARAWSGYVDSLFHGAVHNWTASTLGEVSLGQPFSPTLDLLACFYVIVTTVVVALGVYVSATVTTILSLVSVLVLLFVSVMGLVIGNASNIANADHGGFLPMGFGGVLAGTSACYYAFSGFDVICMSAEEARDPAKSVPRAIILELLLVTVLYCGASAALIAIVPYWSIDVVAPLPEAFQARGVIWAKYIVTIGPALGISNLNILNMYNITRHVYCMASDGLLLEVLARVNSRTKSPLVASLVFGFIIAASTLVFDIKQLVSFNVISGLLCYAVIAAIVVLNRVEGTQGPEGYAPIQDNDIHDQSDLEGSRLSYPKPLNPFEEDGDCAAPPKLANGSVQQQPPMQGGERDGQRVGGEEGNTARRPCGFDRFLQWIGVRIWVLLLGIVCAALGLQLGLGHANILALDWRAMTSLTLLVALFLLLNLVLYRMCKPSTHGGFRTPFVPLLPTATILVNCILLVTSSDTRGSITFTILVIVGLLFYLSLVLVQSWRARAGQGGGGGSGEETVALMSGSPDVEVARPAPQSSNPDPGVCGVPHSDSDSEDEEIDELDLDLGVVSSSKLKR